MYKNQLIVVTGKAEIRVEVYTFPYGATPTSQRSTPVLPVTQGPVKSSSNKHR